MDTALLDRSPAEVLHDHLRGKRVRIRYASKKVLQDRLRAALEEARFPSGTPQ